MEARPAASNLEARLRFFESDTNDWYLELGGQRLAILRDPQWAEMFWTSYRVDLLPETPNAAYITFSLRDWDSCKYTLRHVETELLVPDPLIAGFHVSEVRGDMIYAPGGRIALRSVYPDPPQPTVLEWIYLACRFLKRSPRNLVRTFTNLLR